MKKFLRAISLLMVFVLTIQITPMGTIAEAIATPDAGISPPAVKTGELLERKDLRDKFTKVFEREDGSYTAVVSAAPIHFEEDSKWQDIDNTLTESTVDGKTVLKNTDNAYSVSLPKSLTGGGEAVKIEKDGYTFSYAINNVSPPAEKNSVDAKAEISIKSTDVSDVQKAAKLEEKSSTVKYSALQPDVDIEYVVLPESVKENIILNQKPSGNKQFSFTVNAPGLKAELLPDNSIEFYGKEDEAVFSLPAPFMFDANDVQSKDIKVTFSQNGEGTYTLTYNPSEEWLQAKERVYPVVIDPVVIIAPNQSNYDICDTYVTDASGEDHSHGSDTFAIAGTKNSGSYWAYFRPERYFWASKAVVTNAKLKVYAKSETAQAMTLAAYTVTNNWFETARYSNKPTNDPMPIDYAVAPTNEYGQLTFDITKAFPRNQDSINGAVSSFGVMLGAYNSGMNSAVIYTSEYTNTQYTPIIEYSYIETTGLCDKYEYHTHSAGRAGTVSVNDFTGGMYIERDEIGIDGNIMPVKIKQYYSTATADLGYGCTSYALNPLYNFEDYGHIWLTNYHRFVGYSEDVFVDENGNSIDMYLFIDGTGEITYFVKEKTENGLETWVEQYEKTRLPKGYTLTVPATSSGGDDFSQVVIKEPSGEKLGFDEEGRMTSITAADDEHVTTAPQILITYKAPNQGWFQEIAKIVDGVGREYRFTYDIYGRLQSIQAYDAQGTAIKVGANNADLKITYTYEGNGSNKRYLGRLISATYPDGKTVNYSYVSSQMGIPLIESVTDINGYRLTYTYDNKLAVTQIAESALDSNSTRVTGNVVDLTYDSPYQRTYEDSYDNIEVAQFDNYGRKIGIYNDEGQYKRTTYEDSVIDEVTYNLLSGTSYVQAQNDNLVLNPSFESGTANWTVVQGSSFAPGIDNTVKNTGSNSYKMNCSTAGTIGLKQSFAGLSAGTYTFSAYVKVLNEISSENGGAKISIENKDSSGTTVEQAASGYLKNTGDIWQRLSVKVEVTSATPTVNVYLWLQNGTGTVYFDNAKLEKADLDTPYNVLLNSQMNNVANNMPNNWTGTNLTSADVATTQTKFGNTVNVMKITGSTTAQKSISQSFNLSGTLGDVIDIGCWAKANAASNSNAKFRMRATYSYTDMDNQTVNVTETLNFIPYAEYWQFVADSFTLKGECSQITIHLDYDNQINEAYFTDVRVDYTDVLTGGAEEQNEEEPVYCVCGEENCAYGSGCDCQCDSADTCTCLQCRETTVCTYDNLGNITSITTENGTKEMVTANSYTADKNYLASATNSAGNVVQYNRNTANGTLTSVTDSLNKTVNYTYTAMGALASVTLAVSNLSSGTALNNTYEYTNDCLTGIAAGNAVDYSFDYDLWGYQTEVRVGTQSLAEYTYGTGENCGRVASITFGNGQSITFSYDSYNNVTGISYDGGTTYSYTYTYSSTKGLATVTDNVNNQITYFNDNGYEIYTNLQSGQGVLLYSSAYDEDDNFVQTANGYSYTFADGAPETEAEAATRRSTGLTVKRSTISSTGTSLTLSASTDFFGRPVNRTLGVKDGANNLGSVAVEYTYQNGTGNRTTELVSNYKNVVTPTTGSAANVEYTYTYDANGNILSDSVGGTLMHTYVYDEAGQLVRVNDAVQNNTFCYTYDNGGNLVYKKRYAYTTGALGPALQTSTYAYGDSNWKDKLTAYNGIPLTYDAMGNLTEFEGINFTWTAGRQLKQYEFNNGISDLVVDYKYNADGLRTQKKVTDNENFYSVTYDYIWADGKLVSRTDGTDVLYFIYDSNNSPIGVILNDSATYLYIKNLQGDVTGIADENGNIIVNYSYDEWGRLLSMTGSGAGTIGLTNPLRYSGYYYDAETGYYYLQSRYYSPYWGRFLNADIYCDTGSGVVGTNMFAYCDNNPVMFVDPSGTICYIFYLPEWIKEAEADRKVLMKYYKLSIDKVRLVSIRSRCDLTTAWNSITTYESVDTVIINTHAMHDILTFGNGSPAFNKDDVKALRSKGMKNLILYGCNAGHYDHICNTCHFAYKCTHSNIAAEFAKKLGYSVPVLASDGTVSRVFGYYRSYSGNGFKTQRLNTRRDNLGWIVYRFNSNLGKYNYAILGKKYMNLKQMLDALS